MIRRKAQMEKEVRERMRLEKGCSIENMDDTPLDILATILLY